VSNSPQGGRPCWCALPPKQRAGRRMWTAVIVASTAFLALMGFLWRFKKFRPASGAFGHLFGHWQLLTVYAAAPTAIAFGASRAASVTRSALSSKPRHRAPRRERLRKSPDSSSASMR